MYDAYDHTDSYPVMGQLSIFYGYVIWSLYM